VTPGTADDVQYDTPFADHSPGGAACEDPNVLEIADCCNIGLKVTAEPEARPRSRSQGLNQISLDKTSCLTVLRVHAGQGISAAVVGPGASARAAEKARRVPRKSGHP